MDIDIRQKENIFVVTPDRKLSEGDVQDLALAVNGYINETDSVPSLVFVAQTPPIWADFDALKTHLHFVKSHHQIVKKVAIVSDSKLLWLARPVVDHFTGAKVRRFNLDAQDDAVAWAQMEDDHPGSIDQMDGLPRDVVGIKFNGLITSQDYTDTLVPLIAQKAAEHDKLKLLCVMDQYFDGYSAGAMWDDLRFGFSHMTTFSKIALVTDLDWIRKGAKLFGSLMPTEVMVFDLADIEDAEDWIKS